MTGPQIVMNDDTARVRRSDDLTSHAAADSNDAADRSEVERIVLARLTEHPSTDAELTDWYWRNALDAGWPVVHIDSVRKRRSDLQNKGLVVATNITRLSPTGRKSRVYGVTVDGAAA